MTKGVVHRKPRIIYVEQATIWAARQSMVCQTINLSETGLLLIPPFSSEPGLTLRVDIPLPGLQRPLVLPAVLVREGEHEGEYAWGVKFELVSADAQKFLRHFLQEQVARQFPDQALEGLLPDGPELQTSTPQQVVITPTEPLVQPTAPGPARPKHKPIDRSAARRVSLKRRVTGPHQAVGDVTGPHQAIAGDITGPHELPPTEDQTADLQPTIAPDPEDQGTQPDVAPASLPPSRVPAYSGPLSGEAPPLTAPQLAQGPEPAIKKTTSGLQRVPSYSGPLTGEAPPPPAASLPGTGSHPAVSPAPAAEAVPVAAAPPTTATPPASADEPQLSVTLPANDLLLDRPPVQEEGTPDFNDVPEWSDKSEVPTSGKNRDLLAETEKAENKLDDIFKDAVKQLDLSDSWGASKKKKKKKKGWF
jgi:hypothetical protein